MCRGGGLDVRRAQGEPGGEAPRPEAGGSLLPPRSQEAGEGRGLPGPGGGPTAPRANATTPGSVFKFPKVTEQSQAEVSALQASRRDCHPLPSVTCREGGGWVSRSWTRISSTFSPGRAQVCPCPPRHPALQLLRRQKSTATGTVDFRGPSVAHRSAGKSVAFCFRLNSAGLTTSSQEPAASTCFCSFWSVLSHYLRLARVPVCTCVHMSVNVPWVRANACLCVSVCPCMHARVHAG